MQSHTDLLNFIAHKINAKTYLEIGVFNTANNFDKINVGWKQGVDPAINTKDILKMTSDEYFEDWAIVDFDLIFLDGLHHADQVKRDIKNAWNCLNEGGVIVIHDCNPEKEEMTFVPRKAKIWTGDVYKTVCQIISPKFTVDFDYGCCVIRKGSELLWNDLDVSWSEFDKSRKELLNLVSVEEVKQIY